MYMFIAKIIRENTENIFNFIINENTIFSVEI